MPRINSYDPNYNLRSVFETEVEKVEQEQLYHLVQLDLPTDAVANPTGQPFRIVDANHDVVFGWPGDNEETKPNYTYSRFPVKFSPAEVNADGSISKASITIANVSRDIMYYVEHLNGLRGCRLHIKTAYAGALYYLYSFGADGSVTETVNPSHNPSACLHDEYLIDNYTANEQTVNFQLDPIIDLEIRIPRRRYMVDSCFWEYKNDETCGYVPGRVVGMAKITAGSTAFTTDAAWVQDGVALWGALPYGHYTGWFPQPGDSFRFTGDSTIYTVSTFSMATLNGTLTAAPASTRSGTVSLDVSTDNVCTKNMAACRLRANQARFGGFPGISGSRRIYL